MKTSVKILHWLPRIICILAILFISMFSLDVFTPGLTIWQQLGGFLIHNIPSFVILVILIIAWKWEFTGGITFIILGLVFYLLVFLLNHYRNQFSVGRSLVNAAMIAVPIIIVGILFVWSHNRKKKDLPSVWFLAKGLFYFKWLSGNMHKYFLFESTTNIFQSLLHILHRASLHFTLCFYISGLCPFITSNKRIGNY